MFGVPRTDMELHKDRSKEVDWRRREREREEGRAAITLKSRARNGAAAAAPTHAPRAGESAQPFVSQAFQSDSKG